MRPSFFPYSIANQATKDMYAIRKQVRLMRTVLTRQESIHAAKGRRNEDSSSLRNIIKVMEIKDVEIPEMTRSNISHLQYLALLPLSENE
jgi:hypothetical protein